MLNKQKHIWYIMGELKSNSWPLTFLGIQGFPSGPGRMPGGSWNCGSVFSAAGEIINVVMLCSFFIWIICMYSYCFPHFYNRCFFTPVSPEREFPDVWMLLSEQAALWGAVETVLRLWLLSGQFFHDFTSILSEAVTVLMSFKIQYFIDVSHKSNWLLQLN